jgi:DNA-3-methyladenine glycosylase I
MPLQLLATDCRRALNKLYACLDEWILANYRCERKFLRARPSGAVMTNDQTHRRCAWAGSDPLMCAYHDREWGAPQHDGRMLWEMLMLEGFQAGLAWITVLRKRDGFRKAFAGFDPVKVARFKEKDILRLLQNEGIIRSRAKIEATIRGAQIFCEMAGKGESFDAFCWSFTDGKVLNGDGRIVPAQTALSAHVSKELKRQGFKFVGPTIVYAWMQAVGIVNDHAADCFRRSEVGNTA